MERLFIAKPYKYVDRVFWHEDRYEIFVPNDKRELISVGGAIRSWSGRTIVFLCKKGINREIALRCRPRR